MYISITEAQGQLLDLVRRAEAGEEVLLTHEGEIIGRIAAEQRKQTREEKLAILEDMAKAAPKREGEPDAAHSQHFLYDENGLPA